MVSASHIAKNNNKPVNTLTCRDDWGLISTPALFTNVRAVTLYGIKMYRYGLITYICMLDKSRLKRMDDVNCETVFPQTGSLSFSLSGWQQKYCLISAIFITCILS